MANSTPSHPGMFYVQFTPGDFMSSLHASRNFVQNERICQLTGWVAGGRTRTSFQCGPSEHLEFNNDLVFSNHSCAPNLGLDLSSPIRAEWSVVALRDICQDDEVTWFYPSTEWDAWGGGFKCRCGSKECIGVYRGAKEIDSEALSQHPLIQPYVVQLAEARDKIKSSANGHERRLRIAYTFDRASDYLALGFTPELCAEFDTDHTIDCVATSLSKLGHVEIVGNFHSLVSRIATGAHKEWDIVFNYTEGVSGVAREAQTPIVLEAFRVPFTLSDATTQVLCLNKAQMKLHLQFWGIPTAPFAIVSALPAGGEVPFEYASAAVKKSPYHSQLTFPLFAKPVAEGSSKGVHPASKIHDYASLEAAVSTLLAQFPGQNILIEPFLEGREFNVSILGTGSTARVIGVIEYSFHCGKDSPGMVNFLSYDMKNAGADVKPEFVNCDMSDPVIQAAAETGLQAWRIAGCWDAGSVDIRYSGNGDEAVPFVLEVNTIPGLSPDRAVFSVCARANGITFDELVAEMVNGALARLDTN